MFSNRVSCHENLPNDAQLSNWRPPGCAAVPTNWLRSRQAKKTTPTGPGAALGALHLRSSDTMSTDSAAAPAPKRARVPYRPPLLSLWARNDLADSVVAFLPGTNLSTLPVISKAFRAAQPLVLFTAARRLKVLDRAQDRFLDVLREVTPERRWFRERWTGGLDTDRWQCVTGTLRSYPHGLRADTVGSPPYLRLLGTNKDHVGLTHRLSRSSSGRSLAVKRFRCQVTFPGGSASGALGYIWLCRDWASGEAIGGIYGCYRGEDHEVREIDPADRVGTLKWISTQRDAYDEWANKSTELCTVTPGVCYEVTASFSGKDANGLVTATVTVTPRGQPPSATHSIRCLANDLERIEIYNFHNGESHIGDVEVGYESEDA